MLGLVSRTEDRTLHGITILGSAQGLGQHEEGEQTGLAMPALVQSLIGAQRGCSKCSADNETEVIYLGVIAACRHWKRRIQVFPAANGIARIVLSIRIMLVVWGEVWQGEKEGKKKTSQSLHKKTDAKRVSH